MRVCLALPVFVEEHIDISVIRATRFCTMSNSKKIAVNIAVNTDGQLKSISNHPRGREGANGMQQEKVGHRTNVKMIEMTYSSTSRGRCGMDSRAS